MKYIIGQQNKLFICFFLIFCFIYKVNAYCEVASKNNTQTGLMDVCQMCYLSLSNHNFLYKCKKNLGCTSLQSNNSLYKNNLDTSFQCKQTTSQIYEAAVCEKHCCSIFQAASSSSVEYQTKTYCKSAAQLAKMTQITAILILLSIGIMLIVFLIISFKKIMNSNRRDSSVQNKVEQPQIKLEQYKLETQGPYHMNAQQNCAICLENQCNIYTICGHYYHPKCIAQWLIKNHKCPVCISKTYNPVKVYCLKCKIGVIMAVISSKNLLKPQGKQSINAYQSMICEFCDKTKNIEEQHVSIIKFEQSQLSQQAEQQNQGNLSSYKQQISRQQHNFSQQFKRQQSTYQKELRLCSKLQKSLNQQNYIQNQVKLSKNQIKQLKTNLNKNTQQMAFESPCKLKSENCLKQQDQISEQ